MREHWLDRLARRVAGHTTPLRPAPSPERRAGGQDGREWEGRFSRPEALILFFNTMWGEPRDPDAGPHPVGCRLTGDRQRLHEAAAVVFHVPTLDILPDHKPGGQLWVAWSLECEANYPRLRDPDFMRRFDLTMTYRLDADVVTTYADVGGTTADLARALRTPPRPKPRENLAAMFISSTANQSGRLEYAAQLMRHLDVHSYGQVLQNRRLGVDRGRPSKLDLIASYHFTLAFENAVAEDYVTEKLFDPLIAGSVPVYLGAPNVERFLPGDRCLINTADFREPRELADYLLHLQRDQPAYTEYLAWKTRPFRPAFLSLLATQETPAFERLCRAVRQRRRGHP
jgi:hypothetical protein